MADTLFAPEPTMEVVPLEKKIESGIAVFNSKKDELTALAEGYKGLKVTDLNDTKQLKSVYDARQVVKKARIEIEKGGKSLRDNLTVISKTIYAKERELTGIIAPVEDALQAEEDRVSKEKENIRLEAERKEAERIHARVKSLIDNGCTYDGLNYTIGEISVNDTMLKVMDDDVFTPFIEKVTTANAAIVAEKAEAERLEKEAADKKKEDERVESERIKNAAIALQKEMDEFRAEQARVKVKNDKAAADLKAESDRIANEKAIAEKKAADLKLKEDQARIAAMLAERKMQLSQLGFIDDATFMICEGIVLRHEIITTIAPESWESYVTSYKDDIATIKKNTETKRLQDIEDAKAKAIADEAEKVRIANEAAAKEAALAPDKEKLTKLAETLSTFALPEMATEAGKIVLDEVVILLQKVNAHINKKIKTL